MPSEADCRTATVTMTVSGRRIELQMTLPAAAVPPRELLPMMQSLTNTFVDVAVKNVEDEGRTVSCKAGCGACCRQLVPLVPLEAFQIRDLVRALPEPRRGEIIERFAAAARKLEAAGIAEPFRKPELLNNSKTTHEMVNRLGLDFFAQGIACPFLEAESCSIHAERPLACREYLVTSPAEHCAAPTAEKVKCVPVAAKVSTALRRLTVNHYKTAWVPLIFALEWTETHEETIPPRPGTEFVQDLFACLQQMGK